MPITRREFEDRSPVERAEAESLMSPRERERDQEDFEARRDDAIVESMYPGAAAEDAAEDDLESR